MKSLTEKRIGSTKVSQILPILKMISVDYGFKLNTPDGLRTARRAVTNCAKNN